MMDGCGGFPSVSNNPFAAAFMLSNNKEIFKSKLSIVTNANWFPEKECDQFDVKVIVDLKELWCFWEHDTDYSNFGVFLMNLHVLKKKMWKKGVRNSTYHF